MLWESAEPQLNRSGRERPSDRRLPSEEQAAGLRESDRWLADQPAIPAVTTLTSFVIPPTPASPETAAKAASLSD
jgi:hypothetical protein